MALKKLRESRNVLLFNVRMDLNPHLILELFRVT